MDVCTLGLPSALLFCSLLLVTVSGSQKCVPRVIPDMVIDISQAVAHGARFTDPLRVSSAEECLSACCMQQDKGGDRDCNLLVFDARKGPGLQNCYIFHCPTLTSCPLSPAVGVISYSFWSEPSHSGKHDPDRGHQQAKASDRGKPWKTSGSADPDQDNKKTSAVIASQVSAKHYTKEETADASKSIATQLLHLADEMDQHLDKMESKTEDDLRGHHPSSTTTIVPAARPTTIPVHRDVKKVAADAKVVKPGRVPHKKLEDLKTYFPTEVSRPVGTTPRISTAAPQPVTRKKAGPTVPPAASQDVSGAKKVLGSAKSAALASPKKVDHPPPHTEGPELTTAHKTKPPQRATHPAPARTSPREGADKPSAGDETPERALPDTHPTQEPAINLEEAPRGALPSFEDKSGLVAALVFGMLFFMVVIGVVSRKVSEARRRHRYTKLDYLINGMYVDT